MIGLVMPAAAATACAETASNPRSAISSSVTSRSCSERSARLTFAVVPAPAASAAIGVPAPVGQQRREQADRPCDPLGRVAAWMREHEPRHLLAGRDQQAGEHSVIDALDTEALEAPCDMRCDLA